jgi:hypothetical protein
LVVLAVGLAVAPDFGFFAIWVLMRVLDRFSAWPFVVYRRVLGIVLLVGSDRLADVKPHTDLAKKTGDPDPAIWFQVNRRLKASSTSGPLLRFDFRAMENVRTGMKFDPRQPQRDVP